MRHWLWMMLVGWCFLAQPCAASEPDRTPELATGRQPSQLVRSRSFMVATANPHASRAAKQILQQGGSAADAAIAATLVLTLVEPQSSGLGGGCFSLYWDQGKQRLTSYDGRETAPGSVDQDLFIEAGRPLPFLQAVAGGRAVGVPGQLQSLFLLHQQQGKLAWPELFSDAIRLAEQGFRVSPRLAQLLEDPVHKAKLLRDPTASQYFYPAGKPLQTGTLLKNPQLAESLRLIAAQGSNGLYRGPLAKQLIQAVQQDANPGKLQLVDLARYQAQKRPPVCAPYRKHLVCGMGPPSSGGVTLLQMLGILEQTDIATHPPLAPEAIHLFAQAGRLAFADRNRYLADTDFVPVPTVGLLAPAYLKSRAALIDPERDHGKRTGGEPDWSGSLPRQPGLDTEQPGTSHLSIIDAAGNAIVLTASIEQGFGSGIMVGGFLLNNQLTDFSFRAKDQQGELIANRVAAEKRPRSSMAPTLVFSPDGDLKMLIGSPGGSRIIPYVAQTILGVVDWRMSIQQAINLPHYLHRNGQELDLEAGTELEALQQRMQNFGYQVRVTDLNSGLQGIVVSEQGLEGGSDPRREGLVLGE